MEKRRKSSKVEIPADTMGKPVRRRERTRERWLITRKTWKYMADAGRRLIPEGAQNRPEDIPKIEAYFNDVCSKEPKFLLWRKSSYPGALPRPRRKKRSRGGSVRARSPSDDVLPPVRAIDLSTNISGGRLDLAKMKRDFFAATPAPVVATPKTSPEDEAEKSLVEMLRKYLKVEEDEGPSNVLEADELVTALRKFFSRRSDSDTHPRRYSGREGDRDTAHSNLIDTLSRYYNQSPNRDHTVQELLTDRNLLKQIYFDLRKTKAYRRNRGGGSSSVTVGSRWGPLRSKGDFDDDRGRPFSSRDPPLSPPPLIEVHGESLEEKTFDKSTQTLPIPDEVLQQLEKEYRERVEVSTTPTSPTSPPSERKPSRRRSSVDNDDVSQSVSDTIKRYLRMARKKSVDSDKADRFKRINYDKNLRNIKPREVGEADDDGLNRGCQTEEGWMLNFREMLFVSIPSTPSSPPPSPLSPPSFFSSLLGKSSGSGGGTVSPNTSGGMQKSRSSSSVVSSVSKRIFRPRSRSTSRPAPTWTPQGLCAWADGCGRAVRLKETTLFALTEVERKALQQAALARLQQLHLGCSFTIPNESLHTSTKPKRRTYLLKRKALTTGFFDQSRVKEGDKDKDRCSVGGSSAFGVSLSQCVESERAQLRRLLKHSGSRSSVASVGLHDRGDDSESCDSGDWGSNSSDISRFLWTDESIAKSDSSGQASRVPAIVNACIAHLRRHGLHTVGLFRVSSSKKRVRQLREDWEQSAEVALESAESPHDVATLLKEFLRDLPDPLLCRDLYQAFLHTQKIRNRQLQWEALQLVVTLLPAAHRDTLSALLAFLAQLASHSKDTRDTTGNKMDAANLATVFAPTMLHRNKPGEEASGEQLSERDGVIDVVRQLIERHNELFHLSAELLHDAYIHLSHSAPATLDELLLRRADTAPAPETITMTRVEPAQYPITRVSRENFLHSAAATGGPDRDVRLRRSDRNARLARRSRDSESSSAITVVARLSGQDDIAQPDSAHDSPDSASDYNENLGNSDDEHVITASLHIPAAARAKPAAPPRRRRRDPAELSDQQRLPRGSRPVRDSRESGLGSGTASPEMSSALSTPISSPPMSPPARSSTSSNLSSGSAKTGQDIERLLGLSRERNTSDARAVALRGREREREVSASRSATTLYKRNDLISSARPGPHQH